MLSLKFYPYVDLLDKSSREAKKDPRIQESGRLWGFRFFGTDCGRGRGAGTSARVPSMEMLGTTNDSHGVYEVAWARR